MWERFHKVRRINNERAAGMKNMVRNALVTVMGLAMVGCEWSGGGSGGGGSWSSRYNFVNFSGSYRGSPLVSAYSSSGGGGGGGTTEDGDSYVNQNETQTRNVQLQSVVSGKLNHPPIVPGSLSITAAGTLGGFSVGFSVSDDGAGNLSGASFNVPGSAPVTVSGKVVYNTGSWYLNMGGSVSYAGSMDFEENYSQLIAGGSSGGSLPSSSTPGSSGVTIYAFNVQQEGNALRIVDNNGNAYEGRFGSIRTTGGTDQDSKSASFSNGDQVMATFEAHGYSAAGIGVKMAGNFQATISGVSSSTSGDSTTTHMTLGGRTILGTWMEDGGATGDINGTAASVRTSSSTSTNAP
jgi:hypothetical protein